MSFEYSASQFAGSGIQELNFDEIDMIYGGDFNWISLGDAIARGAIAGGAGGAVVAGVTGGALWPAVGIGALGGAVANGIDNALEQTVLPGGYRCGKSGREPDVCIAPH